MNNSVRAADLMVLPSPAHPEHPDFPEAASLSTEAFETLLKPLSPASRMVAAVSGGRDSTALALLLARWRDGLEVRGERVPEIFALTVDHGLRADSRHEARQVGFRVRELGFRHEVLTWEGDKPATGLQAAAREARYALMLAWARENNVPDIVLAHHREDQAETVLMRLQRGSGVDGLSAMQPVTRREGVRLLRPLLGVPGVRLETTLEEAGQQWFEDPANHDERHHRVWLRKRAADFSALGLSAGRLAGVAKKMARARVALEYAADGLVASGVLRHKSGFCVLKRDRWAEVPEDTGLRVLARLLKAIGGQDYSPRQEKLEALYQHILAGFPGGGRTLGGCQIVERTEGVVVLREKSAMQQRMKVAACHGGPVVWDRRFEVVVNGYDGFPEIGPLGNGGTRVLQEKGVSLADGVLRAALETSPAIWDRDCLVAAPLSGWSGDASLNVTINPVWEASVQMAGIYQG